MAYQQDAGGESCFAENVRYRLIKENKPFLMPVTKEKQPLGLLLSGKWGYRFLSGFGRHLLHEAPCIDGDPACTCIVTDP